MRYSATFLLTPLVLLFLSGCLQEDPQLQVLRDERDAALANLEKVKEEAQKASSASSSSSAEVGTLKREIETLKIELAKAREEVTKAKESTPEVLSEEELLIRLRTATEEHRKAIREKFDVVNIVLTDFTVPEKLTHPYRCGVQYDLIEKISGEPYYLDVQVRAPMSGKWEVPPVEEFAGRLKKGSRSMATNAGGHEGGATASNGQVAGGQAASGQPTVTRVEGLPTGGNAGGQANQGYQVQRYPAGGQQITGNVQNLPGQHNQIQQNAPPAPPVEPSGPGVGNVSKKLKVNW